MHTTDKNTVLERRAAMMARLQQIHDHAAGEGTDEGAMIVTLEGYISGIPEFFTNDCMRLSGSETECRRNLLLQSLWAH